MSEFVTLTLIISLFSLIQSVFGVGLLLFGTVYVLGYSYSETLWIVLPASLSISLAQIYGGIGLWNRSETFCSNFAFSRGRHFDRFQLEGLTDVSKIVGAFLLIMGLRSSAC